MVFAIRRHPLHGKFSSRTSPCRLSSAERRYVDCGYLRRIAAMRRTVSPKIMFWLFALALLCGTSGTVSGQTPKPEGIPFDAATSLNVESPPPGGVAIKAGRLFDPRSGT